MNFLKLLTILFMLVTSGFVIADDQLQPGSKSLDTYPHYRSQIEDVLKPAFDSRCKVRVLFCEFKMSESIVGIRKTGDKFTLFVVKSNSSIWGALRGEYSSDKIGMSESEVSISPDTAKRIIRLISDAISDAKPPASEIPTLDGSTYIFSEITDGSHVSNAFTRSTTPRSNTGNLVEIAMKMHAAAGGLWPTENILPKE